MKVFISSTLRDMMPYRQAAKRSVLRAGMEPILLEDTWGKINPKGGTSLVTQEIRTIVGATDVFVLLVGAKYGGNVPGKNISWIEFEAEAAKGFGKPFLLYVTEEFPPTIEKPADTQAFLARLSQNTIYRRVVSPGDLEAVLRRDLLDLHDSSRLIDKPQTIELARVSLEDLRTLLGNRHEMERCAPRVLEELVADLLAADGWDVKLVTANNSPGPDIIAVSTKIISGVSTKMIVECKKHRADRPVDIDVVRKVMYWVNEEYRATFGMIATTSTFTRNAIAEKERMHHWRLDLRDYGALIGWIARHRK